MLEEIYYEVIKKLINEAELNEFSTMGGGAVGGVATPLGAGPSGKVEYADSDATDKKHRSKKAKKKNYLNKSPQFYLKNGGEKKRKRSFK